MIVNIDINIDAESSKSIAPIFCIDRDIQEELNIKEKDKKYIANIEWIEESIDFEKIIIYLTKFLTGIKMNPAHYEDTIGFYQSILFVIDQIKNDKRYYSNHGRTKATENTIFSSIMLDGTQNINALRVKFNYGNDYVSRTNK